jgi:hypothetical protein
MFHQRNRRSLIPLRSVLCAALSLFGGAWSFSHDNHHHCPPDPCHDKLERIQPVLVDIDMVPSALTRRTLFSTTTAMTFLGLFTGGGVINLSSSPTRNNVAHASALSVTSASSSSCSDIETRREIGEGKDAANLAAHPIVRVAGYPGLQYKVLNPGLGDDMVSSDTSKMVKIMYSISQANGRYMYSRGFGFNKINKNAAAAGGGGGMIDSMFGGGSQQSFSDYGIDGLVVDMTLLASGTPGSSSSSRVLPIGIQRAMIGMKRGERRRIQCPQEFGFETSDWNPKPVDFRGQQQIKDYQALIWGRGDTQPAFASPTIWDVEVISIR